MWAFLLNAMSQTSRALIVENSRPKSFLKKVIHCFEVRRPRWPVSLASTGNEIHIKALNFWNTEWSEPSVASDGNWPKKFMNTTHVSHWLRGTCRNEVRAVIGRKQQGQCKSEESRNQPLKTKISLNKTVQTLLTKQRIKIFFCYIWCYKSVEGISGRFFNLKTPFFKSFKLKVFYFIKT